MPKLSIIIPVYNSEAFLIRCLDSVINQTLKDIEIIIINDASSDKSSEIINNYAKKDNRIKAYHFKINKGVAVARNFGIKIATGEFIGFVDSDDKVDLQYFEELYSYTKNYDIIRGIRVIDGKHGKNEYGCIIPSIIRKKVLDDHPRVRFPVYLKRGEDSRFKKWLYTVTNKIFECPDKNIYYHYLKREGSLSNYKLNKENLNA